jgi:hypothetical protein
MSVSASERAIPIQGKPGFDVMKSPGALLPKTGRCSFQTVDLPVEFCKGGLEHLAVTWVASSG